MTLPFADVLVPERSSERAERRAQRLGQWPRRIDFRGQRHYGADRRRSCLGTPGLDGFTYFPFLGVPSFGWFVQPV